MDRDINNLLIKFVENMKKGGRTDVLKRMTINKDLTITKPNRVKLKRNKCKVMYLSLELIQIERDVA